MNRGCGTASSAFAAARRSVDEVLMPTSVLTLLSDWPCCVIEDALADTGLDKVLGAPVGGALSIRTGLAVSLLRALVKGRKVPAAIVRLSGHQALRGGNRRFAHTPLHFYSRQRQHVPGIGWPPHLCCRALGLAPSLPPRTAPKSQMELAWILVVCIGSLLAYANGANDNFKGVATLMGSGTASYRRALLWATVTTALGSGAALILASGLLTAFSGKGLVPTEVASDARFPGAVALAAGGTVLLATRLGFPISTTHALIGALVGAGLVASSGGINAEALSESFLLPLLTSPFLAVLLAGVFYPPLRFVRRRLGVSQETCVCIGQEVVGVVPGAVGAQHALRAVSFPSASVGTVTSCQVRYRGAVMGIRARLLVDTAHHLSAGAVSFARGLNDTPKIAALLLVGNMVAPRFAIIGVGIAMAVGGLLSARLVAETMSNRVTDLNPGQGFAANVVTSVLVIGASKLGLPVSTTHVSCGALFGIGAVTGQAHWKTIGSILLAWAITLPVAGVLGAVFAALFLS